ncbi:hypothetical protein [Cryobacterium arcticum]|uniref:hypothetical protein n=1 Tax=Cryobacterium arcticum TaxID=670052 RepID=UPI0015E85AD9|nr:hypothetical protein [Cryobacterium arcticum]
MASLRVHPDRLEIHLTPAEKTLALRRENVVVQRENIRSVTITDDPWIWVRGIRAPGTLVPLVVAVGVWKFHGGKDFLAIKRKRQAVVIDLVGDEFARLVLSTNHAPDLIASLKLDAAGTEAAAVAEAEAAATAKAAKAEKAAKPVKRARPVKPAVVAEPAAESSDVNEAPAAKVTPVKRTRTKAPVVSDATADVAAAATEPVKPVRRARTVKPKEPAQTGDPAGADKPATPPKPVAAKPARKPAPAAPVTPADGAEPTA